MLIDELLELSEKNRMTVNNEIQYMLPSLRYMQPSTYTTKNSNTNTIVVVKKAKFFFASFNIFILYRKRRC